jgi:hypothetical protein
MMPRSTSSSAVAGTVLAARGDLGIVPFFRGSRAD